MTSQERAMTLFEGTEGFFHRHEGEFLFMAAQQAMSRKVPRVMVEVGSYAGKSTVILGVVAQDAGADVYAIDPHEGEMTEPGGRPSRYAPSYLKLLSTLKNAGLEKTVRPIRQKSFEIAWWSLPIGFLFIDALHDYENVSRDYHQFMPFLPSGAVVAFHDYCPDFPGIIRFVDEICGRGELRRLSSCGSLQLCERS